MAHPRLEALTHDAIVRAAKHLAPGDIRKWSVVVDGREFPVKQLVREAANQLQAAIPPSHQPISRRMTRFDI